MRQQLLEIPPGIGVAALRSVLTDDLIADALRETGRQGQRLRKLPPALVVWLLVGMSLFRSLSIKSVLGRLRDVMGFDVGWSPEAAPHSTAISQARDRLGWETIRQIFRRLATCLLERHRDAVCWKGLPVFVLDATTFLTPDTEQNEEEFGRPGTSRGGKSGFPQFRGVTLTSPWTHIVVDAVFGAYSWGELTLAEYLLPRLEAGTLLLMDRGYYSFKWLVQLHLADAHFLVRVKTGKRDMKPKRRRKLGQGRAILSCPKSTRRKHRWLPEQLDVRLLALKRKGFRSITLATNLLDEELYPAEEIAALYADRWEVELSYRELKTHMAKQKVVFRCKTPDRVKQEAYGLLIAYNCVRGLMAEAAEMTECRPLELSFKECLEQIRWHIGRLAYLDGDVYDPYDLLRALARCRLPPRRNGRRCPREVKIKMSKYLRKRAGKRKTTRRRKRKAG